MELYVYWRVSLAELEAACGAVHGFQRALMLDTPGLQARLLRRADAGAAAEVTVMETYALPGYCEGIPQSLQGRIVDEGDKASATWRQGPRHVEVFVGIDAAP